MKLVWNKKFIFWNFIALIVIKVIFSYSGFQLASIIGGTSTFSKEEVIISTNKFRASLGTEPLKESRALNLAAVKKLEDMITGQYFDHFSPSGTSPWHWFEANNYQYRLAGENLALGFLNASDAVQAWSESKTHRANLLNPNYKEIGVAVAPAKIQGQEGILVVQLFATPLPQKSQVITKIKPQVTSPKTAAFSPTPKLTGPVLTAKIQAKPVSSPAARASQKNFLTAPKPKAVNTRAASIEFDNFARAVNSTFVFYTMLVFLVSLIYILFSKLTKEVVIKTAANLALSFLALVIPLLEVTTRALIF